MIIDVVGVLDHEDGGATIYMDLDRDALVALVSVGIRQVLTEAVRGIVSGHIDTKGTRDASAGEDGDPLVYGEFPGF